MKANKKKKKYKELWSNIRSLIRSKYDNSDDYYERYTKIKFNSDNNLPLNKMVKLHNVIIVI